MLSDASNPLHCIENQCADICLAQSGCSRQPRATLCKLLHGGNIISNPCALQDPGRRRRRRPVPASTPRCPRRRIHSQPPSPAILHRRHPRSPATMGGRRTDPRRLIRRCARWSGTALHCWVPALLCGVRDCRGSEVGCPVRTLALANKRCKSTAHLSRRAAPCELRAIKHSV